MRMDKPGFGGISAVFCLHRREGAMLMTKWRKRRDSNPRYPFRYASFQDWSHQPLGHSSFLKFSMPAATSAKDSVTRHRSLLDFNPEARRIQQCPCKWGRPPAGEASELHLNRCGRCDGV